MITTCPLCEESTGEFDERQVKNIYVFCDTCFHRARKPFIEVTYDTNRCSDAMSVLPGARQAT
jgi:hypothetical protein